MFSHLNLKGKMQNSVLKKSNNAFGFVFYLPVFKLHAFLLLVVDAAAVFLSKKWKFEI